jgi:hypothetical protein
MRWSMPREYTNSGLVAGERPDNLLGFLTHVSLIDADNVDPHLTWHGYRAARCY